MKLSVAERSVLVITALLLAVMVVATLAGRSARAMPQWAEEVPAAPESSPPAEEKPTLGDINTADVDELTTLPGIGEKRAEDIIAYRQEHGPFSHGEDLIRVPGIGESTVDGLLEYATAGGT